MREPTAPAARAMANGAHPDTSVNYRTMGRGTGGVLKRRRNRIRRDPNGEPAPATIPTRYETILYKNNREEKGFGSRSTRFAVPRPPPIPSSAGPAIADGVEATTVGPGTVGLRGAGAFASRVPRQLAVGKTQPSPGPGSYDWMPDSNFQCAAPGGSSPLPSSVFVLPGAGNPAKFYERPAPGPGDYESSAVVKSARGGAPASKSVSVPRDGEWMEHPRSAWVAAAVADVPGPGDYDVGRSISSPPPGWRRPRSASRGRRQEAPAAGEASRFKLGAELLAETQPAASGPGPGEYDPYVESRPECGLKGTSSFQTGLSHLPRTYRPASPGPGEYNPMQDGVAPSSSAAKFGASMSPRFRATRPGQPGPAYYHPKKPQAAQSFHLNIQKNWVC